MTNQDERGVREVVRKLEASWNDHDMDAFGELFAENADFVNVIGMRWRSRSQIREEHRALHQNVFSKSMLTTGETTVLFPCPDVAVARSHWSLTGLMDPEGVPQPANNGVLTHVLKLQNGRWMIIVSQNTPVVAPQTDEALLRRGFKTR